MVGTTAVAVARPKGLTVTVTIGVAQLAPGETVRSVLQRADAALYAGKASGRDQVVPAVRVRDEPPAVGVD